MTSSLKSKNIPTILVNNFFYKNLFSISIQSFAFHDFRHRLSIVQTSLTLLSARTEIRLVVAKQLYKLIHAANVLSYNIKL